jgi:hypothetical protein
MLWMSPSPPKGGTGVMLVHATIMEESDTVLTLFIISNEDNPLERLLEVVEDREIIFSANLGGLIHNQDMDGSLSSEYVEFMM